MDDRLIAFVGVSLAVVMIPGPDMALVMRNVIAGGRGAGIVTSLGICAGVLGWAVVAALGVATILATSAVAFTILKLAGAAYLVVLGVATLRGRDIAPAADAVPSSRFAWHRAFVQGLLSALLNPKLGIFFLTLLPQFIAPGEAFAERAILLALVFDAIGLVWLVLYTIALGAIGSALGRPGPRRLVRRLTGTILVALGVRVALERA